jgi:hypothetical protein
MIECMALLHDPTAQSCKFRGQVIVADQPARIPRKNPPERIGERWKIAVEKIELKAMPRCPCSAGRLISGNQGNCLARLARIAAPESAQPVTFRAHLGALDTVQISRKMCSGQTVPFHRSRATMPKAERPAAHSRRPARHTQFVQSQANWHLPGRSIAEPRATDHEVVALRFRLETEDATGSWISQASERFHDVTFSQL